MAYTVLYVSGGDFGDFDEMLVRCCLYNPASEIEVDHRDGSGWQPSGMQSAQARGTREGLGQLVRVLVAQALQADPDTVEFEAVDADSLPVGKRGQLGLLPAPDAKVTNYITTDGLRVYDLDPLAGDLWAVAGPDGHDPREIDVDDLPKGWRWIDDDEWGSLVCPTSACNHCDIVCPTEELSSGLCDRCQRADRIFCTIADTADECARIAAECGCSSKQAVINYESGWHWVGITKPSGQVVNVRLGDRPHTKSDIDLHIVCCGDTSAGDTLDDLRDLLSTEGN